MISNYSDKTFYILYRIFGVHIDKIITDRKYYYDNRNRESFLGYYLVVMNKFYKLPLENISSQISFSLIWCEKILKKFNIKKYNTILPKIEKYDLEYESAKTKLFKI